MLKLIQLSYNCPHVTVSCEKRSELCFLGGMTCSKVKEGKESRPKTADCASFEAALPGDAVCRLDAGPRLVITIYIYIVIGIFLTICPFLAKRWLILPSPGQEYTYTELILRNTPSPFRSRSRSRSLADLV